MQNKSTSNAFEFVLSTSLRKTKQNTVQFSLVLRVFNSCAYFLPSVSDEQVLINRINGNACELYEQSTNKACIVSHRNIVSTISFRVPHKSSLRLHCSPAHRNNPAVQNELKNERASFSLVLRNALISSVH